MMQKGNMNHTISQEKSMLAQLLATENIQVIHEAKLETAGFDPIGRKLYLPVLKEMSGPVYDLFVLHEVSHALNTPADGFHSEKHPQGPRYKGFLNVVEDARIEKLIKRKYPGGRSGMINGYKKLLEMDFFGIRNLDPNSLPFVDRFNLYFKIGMTLNLKFSNDEMKFIDRGMSLETWEDTESLTNDLWEYAKDENLSTDIQNMMEDMKLDNSSSDEEEGDDPEMGMEGEFMTESEAEEENSSGMKSQAGPNDEEEPEGKEIETESRDNADGEVTDHESNLETVEPTEYADKAPVEGGGFGQVQEKFEEHIDEDPISITDTNFREREKDLADDKFEGVSITARIADHDHKDYTIPYKTLLAYFEECFGDPADFETKYGARYSWGYSATNRWYSEGITRYQNFTNHNKPMVRHMVKEFEMRKSAAMHERSRIHQSGIINPSSLYKYKFDDRIFKAVTSTPEGKNHGLVFFIDCSGSMQHVFGTVIEQTVLMSSFCQMVKIPFRIFGFTNMGLGRRHDSAIGREILDEYERINRMRREDEKEGDISMDHSMRFYEFFNDKMTKREFQRMGEFLISLSDMGHCPVPLSGTPLNETILLGIDLVRDFQNQYGLDICNTILLTDGDSSSGGNVLTYETYMDRDNIPRKTKKYHTVTAQDLVTYHHPKSGTVWTKTNVKGANRYNRRNWRNVPTSNLLQFFEKCTGQNIIGINIFPKFNYYMAQDLDVDIEQARSTMRKSGYLASVGAKGYSKLFSVPNKNLTITDESESKFSQLESGAKTSSITRSFKSMANKRKSQRMFLTEFVSMVA